MADTTVKKIDSAHSPKGAQGQKVISHRYPFLEMLS